MCVMFSQHFEPWGRCFTNFHCYYHHDKEPIWCISLPWSCIRFCWCWWNCISFTNSLPRKLIRMALSHGWLESVFEWTWVICCVQQREVRLSPKDISCVINKCLPGTTHFVRLVAYNEDGQIIEKSKQLTVQTSAPPDAPVLSVRWDLADWCLSKSGMHFSSSQDHLIWIYSVMATYVSVTGDMYD